MKPKHLELVVLIFTILMSWPGMSAAQESAWDLMLRDNPALAEEEGGISRQERQILQRLTPEQAERFAAGEDPSTILLEDGTDFGSVVAKILAGGPGGVYYPVDACRLAGSGVPENNRYPRGMTRIAVRDTCDIPEWATAIAVNVKVPRPNDNGRLSLFPENGRAFTGGFIDFREMLASNNSVVVELCPANCHRGDLVVKLGQNTHPQKVLFHVLGYFADQGETLGGLDCDPGKVAKWDGAAWSCAEDDVGVEEVVLEDGSGLTGGGEGPSVTLGTDPGVLQQRVSDACPDGQSIQSIAEDGAVVCSSADGAWSDGAGGIHYDGGDVGIGTSDLTSKLTVVDNDPDRVTLTLANRDRAEMMFNAPNWNKYWVISAPNTHWVGHPFQVQASSGHGLLMAHNTGNVGIGNLGQDFPDPVPISEKLVVAGTVKSEGLKANAFELGTGAQDGYVLTSDAGGVGSWQPGGTQIEATRVRQSIQCPPSCGTQEFFVTCPADTIATGGGCSMTPNHYGRFTTSVPSVDLRKWTCTFEDVDYIVSPVTMNAFAICTRGQVQ